MQDQTTVSQSLIAHEHDLWNLGPNRRPQNGPEATSRRHARKFEARCHAHKVSARPSRPR